MANIEVAIEVSEAGEHDAASWRAESVCREHPTQWWFAGGQRETLLAKAICEGCVVRAQCLAFALARPEILGIWAATTPTERAALRRAQREGAGKVVMDPIAECAVELAVAVELLTDGGADEPVGIVVASEQDAQEVDIDVDLTLELDREPEPEPAPHICAERPEGAPRRAGSGERYELLTPAEAARLLGVTPNTVTRWSRAGSVSAIQTIGGHRRFRRSEIERVLRDSNVVKPGDN